MSLLKDANRSLARGDYHRALALYKRMSDDFPYLARFVALNIKIAQKRATGESERSVTTADQAHEAVLATKSKPQNRFSVWESGSLMPSSAGPATLYLKPDVNPATDRIVVYVYDRPFPIRGGGSARALSVIRHLRATGYRVVLVSKPYEPNCASQYFAEFDGICRATTGSTEHEVTGSLSKRYFRPYGSCVQLTDSVLHPIAVIATFAWNAFALREVSSPTLRIVDTVDVQFLRAIRARRNGRDLSDRFCTWKEETQALAPADGLIAINDYERSVLQSMLPETPVILAQHAIEPKDVGHSRKTSREVMFVGNDYDPNLHGIQNFIRYCWPRVLQRDTDAVLNVVGTVAARLDPSAGVNLVGPVPDLVPWYTRAACVVNPVLYGTGFSIKNLEALAHGRALVCGNASSLVLRRTPPCIVADPNEMADAVWRLLADYQYRWTIESQSREYVEAEYGAHKVYGDLCSFLRR